MFTLQAEQRVGSIINLYIVLEVQMLSRSHHKRSGAEWSEAAR